MDEDRPLEDDLRWLLDGFRSQAWKLYEEKRHEPVR